jgi:hypothetical protein
VKTIGDFRTEAALVTTAALPDGSARALAANSESGCVQIPGGRRTHTLIELPHLLLSLLCFVGTLAVMVLQYTHRIPSTTVIFALLVLLLVSLMVKKLKALFLRACVRSRADGFLQAFPELPARAFGVEDGRTHEKMKFVIEDSGICLFDERQHRVLLEGCEYRYVIRAKDVSLVEPISRYGFSGARLLCRVRAQQLNFVLKAAGQGPLSSFIQAFSPSTDAFSIATQLNKTLFGANVLSYTQNVLPPPLPLTGS